MVLLQFRSWVVKNKGFLGVIHVCALFLHTYYCGYIFVSSSWVLFLVVVRSSTFFHIYLFCGTHTVCRLLSTDVTVQSVCHLLHSDVWYILLNIILPSTKLCAARGDTTVIAVIISFHRLSLFHHGIIGSAHTTAAAGCISTKSKIRHGIGIFCG